MTEAVLQATARPSRKPRLPVPGVAWLLLALIVGFSIGAPGFASGANVVNITQQGTVLLLLALPMTLIIMAEGLDLSMGASLSLCTVVLAATSLATGSLALGIAAAIVTGVLIGLLNGALIAWLDLPPFVVTLGTLGVAQGLALLVAEGRPTTGVGGDLATLWTGTVLGLPVPLLFAVGAWAFFHGLLHHTRFGVAIVGLGGNREALKLAAISVRGSLIAVYGLGGCLVGIAALLLAGRLGGGHPTAAIGLEFDAIAAVAVGGTLFEGGKGSLGGTVLGVLAVGVMRNGMNLMSMPSSLQVAAVGAVVIAALVIDALRGDARAKSE